MPRKPKQSVAVAVAASAAIAAIPIAASPVETVETVETVDAASPGSPVETVDHHIPVGRPFPSLTSIPVQPDDWSKMWALLSRLPMSEKAKSRHEIYNEMSGEVNNRCLNFLNWYVQAQEQAVQTVQTVQVQAVQTVQAPPCTHGTLPAEIASLREQLQASQKEAAHLRSIMAEVIKQREAPRKTNGFKTLAL
jgi:hypothetical protein